MPRRKIFCSFKAKEKNTFFLSKKKVSIILPIPERQFQMRWNKMVGFIQIFISFATWELSTWNQFVCHMWLIIQILSRLYHFCHMCFFISRPLQIRLVFRHHSLVARSALMKIWNCLKYSWRFHWIKFFTFGDKISLNNSLWSQITKKILSWLNHNASYEWWSHLLTHNKIHYYLLLLLINY